MRILAVSIGRPALAVHGGRTYSTAINRSPATGPVPLTATGLIGDRVADSKNHGGPDRAVCCYCHEHYAHWSDRLGTELSVPSFGENFTTQGLLEDVVCIGDVLLIGDARVQVSQPRQPCWKLANRLGRPELPAWITARAYTGFYLRVLNEGLVEPGSAMVLSERPHPSLTVAVTARSVLLDSPDPVALRRLAETPELSEGWRRRAAQRLAGLASTTSEPPQT